MKSLFAYQLMGYVVMFCVIMFELLDGCKDFLKRALSVGCISYSPDGSNLLNIMARFYEYIS